MDRCTLELSDELKEKLKDLGMAISSALSESYQITEAIASIKESGYDLFLILEATIGLSHNKDKEETSSDSVSPSGKGAFQLDITPSDKQFLESLRIKVDEMNSPGVSGPAGE